jgi:UDP-2-acetamido-3-amino-2,3-dideoxy-glucuronate N-acetyltransferase
MAGVPAKQIGWMSEYGEQIPLLVDGNGEYICPHSGFKYELLDGQMKKQGNH